MMEHTKLTKKILEIDDPIVLKYCTNCKKVIEEYDVFQRDNLSKCPECDNWTLFIGKESPTLYPNHIFITDNDEVSIEIELDKLISIVDYFKGQTSKR